MFYVDLSKPTFQIATALGGIDYVGGSVPPLLLYIFRAGTNDAEMVDLSSNPVDIVGNIATIKDIPTSYIARSGQWSYLLIDNSSPITEVIEQGLFVAIDMENEMNLTTYGNDKHRGEYKGHK